MRKKIVSKVILMPIEVKAFVQDINGKATYDVCSAVIPTQKESCRAMNESGVTFNTIEEAWEEILKHK